ncbi:hypothetical protein Q6276_28825, partial [Klebsiella variicola]
MPYGSREAVLRRSFTIINGPEPIMVRVPPKIVAAPIGIIRLEAGISIRLEMFKTEGRKITTAPIFWIKPERSPADAEKI